jgi:2-haloalkanoic acid dehalogenase type II
VYWSFALFLFLSFNGTYVSFLKKYIFLFFYSLIGCCDFGIAYGISIQKYHVVLENGQQCGDLDIQHTAQYQMDVHYMCSENGRGDDFREKIQFNPSNIITHYEMNGTTEMGARVFERYSLEKNMAIWHSSSDHGKLHVDGKSFYFPTNASYAVHALLIQALEKTQKKELNLVWHRLVPWPDTVEGLTRLKAKFTITTLSNGNLSLLSNMAKNGALPWDLILSAEVFKHYKPDPETYLGVAELFEISPNEVMLAAAHTDDLLAAQQCGLQTAYIHRPFEFGQKSPKNMPNVDFFDYSVNNLLELSQILCKSAL